MHRFIVRVQLREGISHCTRIAVENYLTSFGVGGFEIDEDDTGPLLLAEKHEDVELLKRQFPMILAPDRPSA